MKVNNQEFIGFAEIYDKSRPICSRKVLGIIERYLNKENYVVLDLGCGTGLSSEIFINKASKIIGVDINKDMLEIAKRKDINHEIIYLNGFLDYLDIEKKSIDVVICSQSFHWMEPISTLKEINRILKEGGLFITVDYDWPPLINWKVELAFNELMKDLKKLKRALLIVDDQGISYDKKNHLRNMKQSGYFKYCREFYVEGEELCNEERFVSMALSQQSTQELLKKYYHKANLYIERFEKEIREEFNNEILKALIAFKIRIGVK